LVSALQWLSDMRDPFDGGHAYVWLSGAATSAFSAKIDAERTAEIEQVRAIAERVYGGANPPDP